MTNEKDPFTLLAILDDSNWPEGVDLLGEARRAFSPDDLEPLRNLLLSKNQLVVQRGMHVSGWLGDKTYSLLDAALKSINHPSIYARSNLLDGVLSYTKKITPEQLLILFPLLSDSEPLIQEKMIIVLANVKLNVLDAAIDEISNIEERNQHLAGLNISRTISAIPQEVFDLARKEKPIMAAYLFVTLLREARRNADMEVPSYEGDMFVETGIIWQISRLIARAQRINEHLEREKLGESWRGIRKRKP